MRGNETGDDPSTIRLIELVDDLQRELESQATTLRSLQAKLDTRADERRPRWLRLPTRRLTRAAVLAAGLVAALVPGLLFADFGYSDVLPGKFYYAAVGRLAAAPNGNDVLGFCDPPARTKFCPERPHHPVAGGLPAR